MSEFPWGFNFLLVQDIFASQSELSAFIWAHRAPAHDFIYIRGHWDPEEYADACPNACHLVLKLFLLNFCQGHCLHQMKFSESSFEVTVSPVDCHGFHFYPGDRTFFFPSPIWSELQVKSNRNNKLPRNSPGASNLITELSSLWRCSFKCNSKAVSFLCCLLSCRPFPEHLASEAEGGRLEESQVKMTQACCI